MLKTSYAIAIAAVAAACFVAFPIATPRVELSSTVRGAKSDRADIRPIGSECSQKAWPYFEGACLRQAQYPLAPPRDVRTVTAGPSAAR
jgi:hypothetical protein